MGLLLVLGKGAAIDDVFGNFDGSVFLTDLLRLGLALTLGGMIGIERQAAGQSAGLRTHAMVSVGAAVFTLVGMTHLGDQQVTRVVQGITAGVGFIGAGAILKASSTHEVRGLTTASSVWVAAALGTTAGMGEYALAAAAGCTAFVVLFALKPVSKWLTRRMASEAKST